MEVDGDREGMVVMEGMVEMGRVWELWRANEDILNGILR